MRQSCVALLRQEAGGEFLWLRDRGRQHWWSQNNLLAGLLKCYTSQVVETCALRTKICWSLTLEIRERCTLGRSGKQETSTSHLPSGYSFLPISRPSLDELWFIR